MEHTFNLPAGRGTCQLSVIDTTTYTVTAADGFIEPKLPGHEGLNLPTFCFLLKNETTGKQVLFDLGMRKDWWNSTPVIAPMIDKYAIALKIDKDVAEILVDAALPLESIDAVILSHHHPDHVGNMSLFPTSTAAVVGPGFKKLYAPFYPAGETSPFHEYEFAGRDVIELDFASSLSSSSGTGSGGLEVGGFPAIDYFGDGSCYLLHTPGHTPEHVAALVRTTSGPDSFVFLGADACHFMGVVRPTEQNPMPEIFDKTTSLSPVADTPISSDAFTACHPHGPESARRKPFYCVSSGQHSLYADAAAAAETLDKIRNLDADPRAMIVIAHDTSVLGALPMFPHGTINAWKERGYKEAVMWNWVKELPQNGKRVAPFFVDGLYREGKKVREALQL